MPQKSVSVVFYSFILTSGVGCYAGGRNPRGLAKPRSAVRTLLRTAALLSQLDRVVERAGPRMVPHRVEAVGERIRWFVAKFEGLSAPSDPTHEQQ